MILKDGLFILIPQTYTIAALNPFDKSINRIFFCYFGQSNIEKLL